MRIRFNQNLALMMVAVTVNVATANNTAPVSQLIQNLDSSSFAERDLAMRQLRAADVDAVDALAAAAKGDSLEVTVRAVHLLGDLAMSPNIETSEAAESALTQLGESTHRYAPSLAQRVAGVLPKSRRTRSLAAIRKFGGLVVSSKVTIGSSWTGGDEGLAHLKHIPEIQLVSFQQAKVTDAGLKHLKKMPALTRVTVDRCDGVTDAGVAELKKGRESLSVIRYGGGFLGVSGGDTGAGCQVVSVIANTAAQRAGLQSGDIITKVNGNKIVGVQSLIGSIAVFKPDDKVEIEFVRAGKVMKKQLVLGARP